MFDLFMLAALFPAYLIALYPPRFVLTPRPGRRYIRLFALYTGGIMLGKAFLDYQRTFYGRYIIASYSLTMVLALTFPLVLIYCFQDDWRWCAGTVLPYVSLQNLLLYPAYLSYYTLRPPLTWSKVLFPLLCCIFGCVYSAVITIFLLRRLRPMFQKLSPPMRTVFGLVSPLGYILMNLQQLATMLYYGDAYGEIAFVSCFGVPFSAVALLLFFWLARRQTEQELGYTAAREQMHQRAILAQRDNLERLQKMRRVQRERLLHIRALLEQGQPGLALADLQSMTFQPGGAVRRYADNPVADVALADADRQCRLAGLELRIDGALPRQCALPPADLASLLYNLLSNAVEAARTAQKPAAVEVHFTTAAGRLCVTVCNPVGPRTSPRGPDHGFGLRILREITARHDGSYTLDIRSGRATARAMLCLPAGKGGEHHV